MRAYARAALAARGEPEGDIVVTKTPDGQIVAVTRQDDEGRILSVIAESAVRGEPVVWIQPDHLHKAHVAPFLCRVEPTQRMADFVPLYTAPQVPQPAARAAPPFPEDLLKLAESHKGRADDCGRLARAVLEAAQEKQS
jgi:hypothetical protein